MAPSRTGITPPPPLFRHHILRQGDCTELLTHSESLTSDSAAIALVIIHTLPQTAKLDV